MKKIFLLSITSVLLILSSCKKETSTPKNTVDYSKFVGTYDIKYQKFNSAGDKTLDTIGTLTITGPIPYPEYGLDLELDIYDYYDLDGVNGKIQNNSIIMSSSFDGVQTSGTLNMINDSIIGSSEHRESTSGWSYYSKTLIRGKKR
jgi:hypothetical protein